MTLASRTRNDRKFPREWERAIFENKIDKKGQLRAVIF